MNRIKPPGHGEAENHDQRREHHARFRFPGFERRKRLMRFASPRGVYVPGKYGLGRAARFRITQEISEIGFAAGFRRVIRERLRLVRIFSVHHACEKIGAGRGWRKGMKRIFCGVGGRRGAGKGM